MTTKTHRTQIYLDPEQYDYLLRQAEKEKISMAAAIRKLIDEKLPKEKDYDNNPLFSMRGKAVSTGRKDGSVKHDEYIYTKKGK